MPRRNPLRPPKRPGPIPGRVLMSRILDKLARDAMNAHPPLLLYGIAEHTWWEAQLHFFLHFCSKYD